MKRGSWLASAGLVFAIAWLVAGPAQLGGGVTYVTAHGISMEPAIRAGDLVLIRPVAEYRVGDAVAYHSDALNTVVLHRITAVDDDRYTLQGDSNSWRDPDQPTEDALIGRQWLRIPGGGRWLRRIMSPPVLAAAAFLLFFGGGTAANARRRTKDRGPMADHSSPPPGAFASMSPTLRSVALGAAALGVAGAVVAAIAWSQPAATVVTDRESVTATVDFSYRASVEPSAAYDATTVTDPQPVFRALADTVEVGFRYEGRPGTVSVDAQLSTAGGWASTLPLAEPVSFDGERYEGSVTLDLDTIQTRADDAAEIIGLPATSVNVAVVPRVSLAEGGKIAPRLELVLDAHALRLGGEQPLTVEDSVSIAASGPQPATVTALGRSVDVTTLRSLSVAAVIIAGLLAVALVAVARFRAPVSEAELIRRRYGGLLLPVMSLDVPAGRPLVDVQDAHSLAGLAERCGLPVLHWSDAGVDTYVVQDEAATYRYRHGPVAPDREDRTMRGPVDELDGRDSPQRIESSV